MATLKREVKKLPSEQNLRLLSSLIVSIANKQSSLEDRVIAPWKADVTYQKDISYVSHNGYVYICSVTNQDSVFTESHWVKLSDNITELDVDTIKSYLNLTPEQITTLQSLIDDTTITTTKTNSSSKIYMDIQAAIAECKDDTLKQIAKKVSGSYKIATSTSDVTSADYIYLINNGVNYDLYVLVDSVPTKVGDTSIDLSDYAKTSDLSEYLKSSDADGKFATITTVDGKVNKTDIVDNLTSTDTDKPLSANQGKALDDKKLNKSDVDKIELINVDSVNIKDFILENCTVENKIYHIAARSNCTELPKASSNYYIVVQKVGSFTIKVIAKELAGSNNEYVCTYRSDLSIWTNWDKVVVGERNLNTFTDINQLGLTVPTTVREIFNAMPNFSLLRFQVDNSSVTDAPMPNGILIIDKIRSAKFTIEFKISADGSVADNGLYIGQLKGSDGSGLTWKRVCATSVADVPWTTITPTSVFKGAIRYRVKNGICYVKIDGINSTTMSTNGQKIATGLPKPEQGIISSNAYYPLGSNVNSSSAPFQNLLVKVTDNGDITNHYGTNNVSYFGSFSYPVAES